MSLPADRSERALGPGRTRRDALATVGIGLAALSVPSIAAKIRTPSAVAFDAFVLFDPAPLRIRCKGLFGDHGEALAQLWSTKLFGYTWLLNSMERYEPFLEVARKPLLAAGAALNVRLSTAEVLELVATYGQLDAWPDAANALQRLRTANIHVILLSNLGEAELGANLKRNCLSDLVGTTLSTDRARRFKPAPGAYAMATSALALGPEEIAFAAFAGWDAAGARSFGYQTAWINRLGAGAETLGPAPDVIGTDMEAVLRLAGLTAT